VLYSRSIVLIIAVAVINCKAAEQSWFSIQKTVNSGNYYFMYVLVI